MPARRMMALTGSLVHKPTEVEAAFQPLRVLKLRFAGAVLSTYATMISELVDEPGVKLRWGDYACQGCSAPVRGWGGKTAKDLADSLFRLATEDSPGCVPAW